MIRVTNLSAAYGGKSVLENVSLVVEPREIVVVMGQSGCGKSTFLRHLIGLQKPATGTVEIDGADVTRMGLREYRDFCRGMGVLFQSGGLFNSMTIGENVAFPLHEHTELSEPVIDIVVKLKLQQVGLPGTENLMPSQLSGGMRKRAGLARALALDPTIMFLDEPTTGLDPIIAAGIDELVLRLRDAYKTTMVVVAHDIASGMRIADRIAIFRDRRIVELGTPDEVRASRNPYVQQFLTRQPEPPRADVGFQYLTSGPEGSS